MLVQSAPVGARFLFVLIISPDMKLGQIGDAKI